MTNHLDFDYESSGFPVRRDIAEAHWASWEAVARPGPRWSRAQRVADLSGIPLDDTSLHGSEDFREQLGLNTFSGAANSDLERADSRLAPDRFFPPVPDETAS